ncbi:MAG: hypothetical protein GXO14_01495 [Thermococci archaeon]|nr:hypothetical protein [Thermococci archaeon]
MAVTEQRLRRALFEAIKKIRDDVREGASYGVPHIFGEIRGGEEIEVAVTVLEKDWLKVIIPPDGDGTLRFIYPADDTDDARLFMDLWRFLKGKEKGDVLKPGVRVKGNIEDALRRMGFTILWMNRRDELSGYVQAWIKKGPLRYSVLLRKAGEDEFTVVELKRV